MMTDVSVIVSSVVCLLYFDTSPHLSLPNGLERSQNGPWRFNHCDLNVMVLKEVKMVHGGYYPLCMSQMVLKAANSVCIHNGLEMSQF